MKRLLLVTALFTTAALLAQPVAQNAKFEQVVYNEQGYPKTLLGKLEESLITGGTAPYQFEKVDPTSNTIVQLTRNGNFAAKPTPSEFLGTAKFNYRVTDSTGQISNIATVTIIFGQDKG